MASDQNERQSHRNRPIGTSKRRAIVARIIQSQGKDRIRPIAVPSTGIRGVVNQSRPEIPPPPKLLATRTEKPLPGVPDDYTNIEDRIATDDGNTPDVDLLPHRLVVQKSGHPNSSAQRIYELRKQNGYLLAEVALLKETRITLKDLQDRTQEALWVLQAALQEASRKITTSERRLMSYWGAHSGDGSEEVTAF